MRPKGRMKEGRKHVMKLWAGVKGTTDVYPKSSTQVSQVNSKITYMLSFGHRAIVPWVFFSLYCSAIKVGEKNPQIPRSPALWATSIKSITYVNGKALANSLILSRKGVECSPQWKEVPEFPDQGKDWLFLQSPKHRFWWTPLGVGPHFPSLEAFHMRYNIVCGTTLHMGKTRRLSYMQRVEKMFPLLKMSLWFP